MLVAPGLPCHKRLAVTERSEHGAVGMRGSLAAAIYSGGCQLVLVPDARLKDVHEDFPGAARGSEQHLGSAVAAHLAELQGFLAPCQHHGFS